MEMEGKANPDPLPDVAGKEEVKRKQEFDSALTGRV
jgi:hypothetical protein